MTSINIELGNVQVSQQQVEVIKGLITLITQNRSDQAQLLLSSYNAIAPLKRVNVVHNQLYGNQASNEPATGPRRKTVWDKEIARFQQDVNWIRNFIIESLGSDTYRQIRSLKLTTESNISSLGSCFATNISKHFRNIGFKNISTLRVEEAVNSPRLIDMYLSPEKVPANMRQTWDDRFGVESKEITKSIGMLDLLILTFGVGCDFIDANGDLVLDISNISDKLKNDDAFLRNPSVEEQAGYIQSCVEKIRQINPLLPIFITLSPVPLSGFYGETHVSIANTMSKAGVALAIHKARENVDVIYLPTYEIVTTLAPIVQNTVVWGEDGTTRHPKNELITEICKSFVGLFNS